MAPAADQEDAFFLPKKPTRDTLQSSLYLKPKPRSVGATTGGMQTRRILTNPPLARGPQSNEDSTTRRDAVTHGRGTITTKRHESTAKRVFQGASVFDAVDVDSNASDTGSDDPKLPTGDEYLEALKHLRLDDPSGSRFVYLKRLVLSQTHHDPYALITIEFADLGGGDEYYTMSALGITHFAKGRDAEFTSAQRWLRERALFTQTRSLSTFKRFRTWKGFVTWRTVVRRTKMKRASLVLEKNLFQLDVSLASAATEVRAACHALSSARLSSVTPGGLRTLEEFSNEAETRRVEMLERLEAFSKHTIQVVDKACASALAATERRLRDFFGAGESAPSTSFAVDDDATAKTAGSAALLEYSYTVTATRRTEQRRLVSFVKQLDYVIRDTLRFVLHDSVTDVLAATRQCPVGKFETPPPPFRQRLTHLWAQLGFTRMATAVNRNQRAQNARGGKAKSAETTRRLRELVREAMRENEYRKKEARLNSFAPTHPTLPNFRLKLEVKDNALCFVPNAETFQSAIQRVVRDFAHTLASVRRLPGDERLMSKMRDAFAADAGADAGDIGAGTTLHELQTDVTHLSLCDEVNRALRFGFAFAREYRTHYESFRLMAVSNRAIDLFEMVSKYRNGQIPLDEFRRKQITWMDQETRLQDLRVAQNVGIVQIDSTEFRDATTPSPIGKIAEMRETLPKLARDAYAEFIAEIHDATAKLSTRLDAAQELCDRMRFVQHLREGHMDVLTKRAEECAALYALVREFSFAVTDASAAEFATSEKDFNLLKTVLEDAEGTQEEKISLFASELEDRIKEVNREARELVKAASDETILDPDSGREKVEKLLRDLTLRAESTTAESQKINTIQVTFGSCETVFDVLKEAAADVALKVAAWAGDGAFDADVLVWAKTVFDKIDVPRMTDKMGGYVKLSARLEKGLAPNKMAQRFAAKVEDYKNLLPVINALLNTSMKQRHWDKVAALIGVPIVRDDFFTLQKILDLKAPAHGEAIGLVSTEATQEQALEEMLHKVVAKWADVCFQVVPYKESKDTFMLGGIEEISIALEDSMVTMSTIMSSRFVKGIRETVEKVEVQLSLFGETLDEWLAVQKNWMYLETIFSAPDIQRQLPNEAKQFFAVDKQFRDVMRKTRENDNALRAGTTPGYLQSFQNANEALDKIQKNLEEYLETKRMAFPRFYFLSNDELLEILAQTKKVQAVQPHMSKCFDGIKALDFGSDPKSVDIFAMVSPEGETVGLGKNLKARGNVEQWLCAVETAMIDSLRKQSKTSYLSYPKETRTEWVLNQPAQVVIMVSQIYWCRGVVAALGAKDVTGAMSTYLAKNRADLKDMTVVVRGQLTGLHRKIIAALITIDVHARDIVEELFTEKTQSANDFKWQMQLRYYWDEEIDLCSVSQTNSSFEYAYEYLGAQSRLVVTPMTDRCYMTLTGAMHLKLGGAPAGPAGTGKTESTKDLGKALGVQCVVFNCGDNLDYKFMGKFFAGLAQCGAWACFDEFNRIDIEVLSVVAQQLLTIQNAMKSGVSKFVFEGREMRLQHSFAVFITMNPGYAGRTELPDNLKALFRPMAMMIPDYALVAEVMLFSEGFETSKDLSRKMVKLYKLSSEQLSQQDHYDFGMRALKSVLVMAGSLKRGSPDLDEQVVLIRAMRDSNLPKFLSEDAELFEAIVSDLFPGVEVPEVEQGILARAIIEALEEQNLQCVDKFVLKIVQMFETFNVRFGAMLVGPTGGGKTTVYKTLQRALSKLREGNHLNPEFQKIHTYVLNPKCITMGELYGEYSQMTNEWCDGLGSTLIRNAVADTTLDKKWVVFDGPVDAIWIENMNTVLDDNKKLCLVSGEIVQMSATMTMMFEVEDLAVASPATVSRCGMIYMEPTSLGVEPLLDSFLETLPPLCDGAKNEMREIFLNAVPGLNGALFFLRKHLKETVGTVDTCLVQGCFNVMSSLLKRYHRDEQMGQTPLDADETSAAQKAVLPLWVFSMIWSIGASCVGEGRSRLNDFFRETAATKGFAKHMPPTVTSTNSTCSMYEFKYDQDTGKWTEWMSAVGEYAVNPETPFSQIIVPTPDTVRYTFLIDVLLKNDKHVLCVGDTGTGKTLNVMDKLQHHMPDSYTPVFMTFSARTSANQTQDFLDGRMEKKRKGVYGPPSGKKFCLLIDDLNMPMREKYFAQPPIELLRQWFDHNGWYDRTPPCAFKQIVDVILVACMGPPGGGRNPVSNRTLRHFNFLSFTDMSDASLVVIFDSILGATLGKKFTQDVASLSTKFVEATVEVYNVVRRDLLPTPAKSHYTFNLRDLARVFQGLLRADPKLVARDTNELYGLWMHENMRVFQDRMVNKTDRDWFTNLIDRVGTDTLGVGWDEVVNSPAPRKPEDDADETSEPPTTDGRLIFGDYLVPGADVPVYQRVRDVIHLRRVVEEALEDYNSVTTSPMNLVMFLDAIEHVSRVCRVISLPLGNALLLGVGGSGRQSLTRLAAALEEFELFQIEVAKGYGRTEWRDDLRKVLLMAGCEGKDVVFLFADTQIVQENFLEDVNNILNSGEVPNLLKSEDTEQIGSVLRPLMQGLGLPTTKNAVNSYFITRVRAKLHCVLAMSPVSESFRKRLRMFPSLVNCCTIDWFSEWPLEALDSVANTFLIDVAKTFNDPSVLPAVVKSCVFIHQSVEKKSAKFYETLRRFNYVTPTSYLELLRTFIRLLSEKRSEIEVTRNRLQTGLDKLESTSTQVGVMEKELVALQPILANTSLEVEAMIAVITQDTAVADETKVKVLAQEQNANAKAAEAKAIAADAQQDLDKALPALDAAVQALKLLTKNDVVEVKSLKNPPAGVRLVMEVACIFFGRAPKMVPDTREGAKPGAKMQDYWGQSTDLVKDPQKFLDSLLSYDKDAIGPEIIERADPYMLREDFDPAVVKKVSKACTSICMWARAMHTYYNVSLAIEPKRLALAEAQSSLAVTMTELAEAKATLAGVEAKLTDLNDKFRQGKQKQDELKAEVARCQAQLDRAGKLIGGLGGEKSRWEATVASLGTKLRHVVGDVVVSSGVVAYNGPFTPLFRQELLDEWFGKMVELKVPHTPGADIQTTLADPVQIRQWQIAGLPSDAVSVENGIIVAKARRWPLMIDPQGQANRWIKNMNKECKNSVGETAGGIDVIKLTEKDYLRTLANGIRFGRAVLLENIGEELDAALEPLLQKQTFKQGGSEVIKMGDDVIPYHPDFRFFMTTKMRNPHYQPEVSVKVSLLNFFVTLDGLEDQLLGTVVMQEREDLAEAKNALVVSNARMKTQLTEIEDKILRLLSDASGNILDDEVLIDTLAQSKVTADEISLKVAEAEVTERDIDATREKYRPVATRASVLFFCISDLAGVDPMYQYSLSWFLNLFIRATTEAATDDDVDTRIAILNDFFTYSLYTNICRSLFERHKLMFSLLLTIAIQTQDGAIDSREWRFLLAGPTETEIKEPNPAPEWVTEKVWIEIVNVSRLEKFKGFDKAFSQNVQHYRSYFENANAHAFPLDLEFDTALNAFQKLLIVRCIRPDRFMLGTSGFVAQSLGQRFVEPPAFDLSACYAESSVVSPLVFVLSSGADPMADLAKFAAESKMAKRFDQVSLGQGQGPKATNLIKIAMETGMWVCLQNCHLAESWMPKLDVLVEQIDPDTVHRDFRLWLTSMPSPAFPVAILQNGVKMTLEPPKGLKSNLVRSYQRLSDEYIDESKDPVAHRKLLFSICLFHAVIQDRRKFGPLGWNIPYDFTDGDLSMCQRQIKMMIDDYDVIPFKVIRVLCGEINYGGRVTDDKDRRLINNLLDNFVTENVVGEDYCWSPSGAYQMPMAKNREETVAHIMQMPGVPHPEIFGLHENADITCDQNETYALFETVLSLQPRVVGGAGLSREAVIELAATDIFEKIPEPFDIDVVTHKYPTTYGQSMNTVLTQECIRYSALLEVILDTLKEALKALKGLVVMSPELEQVTDAIFDNRVPEMWTSKAYPSLKPLSSWVIDLLERLTFIDQWIENGPPAVYWISGLFFPQAFLTGTLQNFARKNGFAIDQVTWNFNVEDGRTEANTPDAPASGCYINGFFLEGARWCYENHALAESKPKELYTEFPLFWLEPVKDRVDPTSGVFLCPAYKTLTRAGTLSTTGHSTNFVMYLEIPTNQTESHWINSSVALFTALMF